MEFEWSLEKAKVNSNKHGIHFTEAMTVFNDPLAFRFRTPIIQMRKIDFSFLAFQIVIAC